MINFYIIYIILSFIQYSYQQLLNSLNIISFDYQVPTEILNRKNFYIDIDLNNLQINIDPSTTIDNANIKIDVSSAILASECDIVSFEYQLQLRNILTNDISCDNAIIIINLVQ